jgi:hypothetical protein
MAIFTQSSVNVDGCAVDVERRELKLIVTE